MNVFINVKKYTIGLSKIGCKLHVGWLNKPHP